MAIVVKLKGGLGNQMFQYALAYKLAALKNVQIVLDHSFFKLPAGAHTSREYELGVFRIGIEKASDDLLARYHKMRGSRLTRLTRAFPRLLPYRFFDQKGYNFDPEVFNVADNTLIDGHWQSAKYFEDMTDRIREVFRFVPEPDNEARKRMDHINSVNAISVHIRRGDYVEQAAAHAFHGLCGADYYARAMTQLRSHFPDAVFFIFSDDQAWAKANLDPSMNMVFVEGNNGEKNFEDMRSMSMCNHHIIANSSFSWWGAWLNPSPSKKVIAPSAWFRDPTIDTSDMVPSDWMRH